jgi:hypothetical protein
MAETSRHARSQSVVDDFLVCPRELSRTIIASYKVRSLLLMMK